jgi:predicted 2-oxoglutarate/Fe(II)-dependent dioxygenase YbiX
MTMEFSGLVLDQEVLVVRDFAQPDEVFELRMAFDEVVAAHEAGNTSLRVRKWSSRTEVPAREMLETIGGKSSLIATIRSRMFSTTRNSFAAEDIRPEWTIFSRMRTGDHIPLHADAERRTPDGWEGNHTPWRTHVGLLYLSSAGDDFRGGALVLPEIGRTILPYSGMFVSFPSGRRHEHQVTTIESGARLSFVVWFTQDASHYERGWPT